MSFETTALLLTWVALALLSLVVAGLVRRVHQLSQGPRADASGPQPGMPAPALESLSPEPGRATLLLFLSEGCPPCADIFQETQSLIGAPPIRVLYADDAPDAEPPENIRILPDQGALFEAYQISATPFGAIVGADGRIRTIEPVGSVGRLYGLIAETGGRTREETPADHDEARLNGSAR